MMTNPIATILRPFLLLGLHFARRGAAVVAAAGLLSVAASANDATDSLLLTTVPRSTTSYQIGMGPTRLLDTYLSQEKFHGQGITLLTATGHCRPGSRWTTVLEHQVNLSSLEDRSSLREELQGDYTCFAGRLRHWQLGHGCSVGAGAMAVGNIGFVYNTANSNNPAQGRFSLSLMPTLTVCKDFRLLRRKWAVDYELNLPLVGVMFSPRYGQSYYEIFSLGNYDRNVVATTCVSAPSLRQQLRVGCVLWPRTAVSIGYLGDYQQASVNHLKSHIYSHRIMIGVVRSFSIINHRL